MEVVEPHCRICRDPNVRRLVNKLLDWQGVPIPGTGKAVTYRMVLAWLDPINAERSSKDQITYDSLWIHAKRHYELAGVMAYWGSRMEKELREGLQALRSGEPLQ
jgi:hypothetical protein